VGLSDWIEWEAEDERGRWGVRLLNQHLILKTGSALYWGTRSSLNWPGIVTDFYPIDNQRSSNLRIAITGTVVVHALLLVLLAWMFASEAAHRLWLEAHQPPKEEKKEEEVLLFPEQFLTPPPPPKVQKPQVYIRTSQSQGADTAPKNPAFIADRNTHAATVIAPSPDATEPLPSMDGIKIRSRELADRDFKNGDLKDDARPMTQPPEVAMLAPKPPAPPTPKAPPSILKPKDAAPPQPPKPMELTPKQEPTKTEAEKAEETQKMAKVEADKTPLTKMMEEADKELAKVDKNRLPLEVMKPEERVKTPDAPPKTEPVPKKLETAQDMPPPTPQEKPIPKALPVVEDEAVTRTTNNQDPNAFTPFTRKTQTKGSISNRGKEAAVDAAETPLGRYYRQVTGQVEKKWHVYLHLRRDGATAGYLQIVFYVNKKGKVESLRVVNDKESNPILTELTVRAIQDAEIPPMPADVVPSLPMNDQDRLKVEYDALIY
jgi:outer membrane biosynthesis protein TonB